MLLGTDRIWQGLADEVPRRDQGQLEYNAIGHFPWKCKKNPVAHAALSTTVDAWFIGMVFRNGADWNGSTWIPASPNGLNSTWVNNSERYVDTGLPAIQLDFHEWEASEKLLSDLLQIVDYEAGMFPGPDSLDELGCYVYLKPRLQNKIDWILTRNNFRGVDLPTIDLSYDYYNYCIYKWQKSDGTINILGIPSQASADKYTPGSYAIAFLDLTAGNGWMADADALACAQVFLSMHDGTSPLAKGTITVPFCMAQHTSVGRRHTAFIRAGDNICLPFMDCYEFSTATAQQTNDNRAVFKVYDAQGSVDESKMVLQIGAENDYLDTLIKSVSHPLR